MKPLRKKSNMPFLNNRQESLCIPYLWRISRPKWMKTWAIWSWAQSWPYFEQNTGLQTSLRSFPFWIILWSLHNQALPGLYTESCMLKALNCYESELCFLLAAILKMEALTFQLPNFSNCFSESQGLEGSSTDQWVQLHCQCRFPYNRYHR